MQRCINVCVYQSLYIYTLYIKICIYIHIHAHPTTHKISVQTRCGELRLQYSGPYWGAAVFGQMDLALAFGACNVICYAGQPEDIASACSRSLVL